MLKLVLSLQKPRVRWENGPLLENPRMQRREIRGEREQDGTLLALRTAVDGGGKQVT